MTALSERWRGLGFTRTVTFRLTAWVTALFALSAAFLLMFLYTAASTIIDRRAERFIAAELVTLSRHYERGGVLSVDRALDRMLARRQGRPGPGLYVLFHADGRWLAGNLNAAPASLAEGGPARFFYTRMENGVAGERRRARGRMVALPGGHRLVVGVDLEDERRALGRLANLGGGALGLSILLGLMSGVIVSRRFERRLRELNTVAGVVTAGDFTARAPRTHTGDELDALSSNLNAMWDRTQTLVEALRHAGDAIAHDVRSPLTRLRDRLEAARRAPPEESAQALADALAEADAVLTTFDAVLRIARLESGSAHEALRPLDLTAIAEDLGELYAPVFEERGLAFSLETEPGLMVRGDRGLLSQAGANLLDNAGKYTPTGGAVALRALRLSDGGVDFSVTDTGPGIPEAHRARVRRRFVRLDESRSAPGAGLGLALVEAVTRIHGGRFDLDDGDGGPERPGLRAAITLPAAP